MSVGYPVTRDIVNYKAGEIAVGVRDMLERAVRMKAWLDTQTTADLVALGFVEDAETTEVSALKSAFTDLANLATYAFDTQDPKLFWSDKLIGVNRT